MSEEPKQLYRTKHIQRLFQDCGWRGEAKYRCNICDHYISYYKQEDERYDIIKPQIIEHIINEHPEFCYKCDCGLLFASKGDFNKHKHKKEKEGQ